MSIGGNRIQGVKQIPSSIGGHEARVIRRARQLFAPARVTELYFADFTARRESASVLPAPRDRSARAEAIFSAFRRTGPLRS